MAKRGRPPKEKRVEPVKEVSETFYKVRPTYSGKVQKVKIISSNYQGVLTNTALEQNGTKLPSYTLYRDATMHWLERNGLWVIFYVAVLYMAYTYLYWGVVHMWWWLQ